MIEPQSGIVVEYKNTRPVELLDLTASLSAFGEQFKRYGAPEAINGFEPRLFVQQLRTGSIIAQLIPFLEQADFVIQHREMLGGFMADWHATLEAIRAYSPAAKDLPKPSVRAARNFMNPIAKDNGSQINIQANDGAQVVNQFIFTSPEAAAIVHNADALLGAAVPEELHFKEEPMLLFQVRRAPPNQPGDMGIIDRFADRPVKITFGSEEAKRAILEFPENPFDTIFFVNGHAKTAGGKIAAYHIIAVTGITPKEA